MATYQSWNRDHGWTARDRERAARDAGRVRTDPGPSYDELSKDAIRAEYAAACEMDAWSAAELERRFPWLRHEP